MNWKGLADNSWFVRVVLVLWLVNACFVVVLLGRIDWIVHHDLYGFGLQFSPEWAVGYWAALRMIYVFLATPVFLSVVFFGLEVWHFIRVRRGKIVESKPKQAVKTASARQKVAAVEQNHMLVSCPKCKRVFSKPLVMLDFSGGKTRLVNVCPYCNHVLGCAEEGAAEEKKDDSVGVLDLERRRVERK